jgi:uncharacterized protein (TIGR02996 family)
MSSLRPALIAAIREAPDDDARRLVCADWLEEQGGEANVARAEFIRTQIRRANLPPDDIRHSELQARELRLVKRYAPAWCGSHFVFRKGRFRRGFIEYVHLHLQHFLHHRRQMLELEPVRDVSLTGWFRSPDDLIRRVAGCAEWKHVETLRIHHQGPHKHPRGNLIDLLESPHLTGLLALHCPLVEFDADARRRFERLPFLKRLRELQPPSLYPLGGNPGEWFSDGGAAIADGWEELKSLTVSDYLRSEPLRQFSERAFWDRLTSIRVVCPMHVRASLATLEARIPSALRHLHVQGGYSHPDLAMSDSFFERLALRPLHSLHLYYIPVSSAGLARLLDGTPPGSLRELSLSHCGLTGEHVRLLAASSALRGLLSLDLSVNADVDGDAIHALCSSTNVRSVVRLDLSRTRTGAKGAAALAAAEGRDRLRKLNLDSAGLDTAALRKLLASANLWNVTRLVVSGIGYPRKVPLDITPDLAAAITRLPHLASLHLGVSRCTPPARRILLESDSLAWTSILGTEDEGIGDYRARRAPERWPPLDEDLEPTFGEL